MPPKSYTVAGHSKSEAQQPVSYARAQRPQPGVVTPKESLVSPQAGESTCCVAMGGGGAEALGYCPAGHTGGRWPSPQQPFLEEPVIRLNPHAGPQFRLR